RLLRRFDRRPQGVIREDCYLHLTVGPVSNALNHFFRLDVNWVARVGGMSQAKFKCGTRRPNEWGKRDAGASDERSPSRHRDFASHEFSPWKNRYERIGTRFPVMMRLITPLPYLLQYQCLFIRRSRAVPSGNRSSLP